MVLFTGNTCEHFGIGKTAGTIITDYGIISNNFIQTNEGIIPLVIDEEMEKGTILGNMTNRTISFPTTVGIIHSSNIDDISNLDT